MMTSCPQALSGQPRADLKQASHNLVLTLKLTSRYSTTNPVVDLIPLIYLIGNLEQYLANFIFNFVDIYLTLSYLKPICDLMPF